MGLDCFGRVPTNIVTFLVMCLDLSILDYSYFKNKLGQIYTL